MPGHPMILRGLSALVIVLPLVLAPGLPARPHSIDAAASVAVASIECGHGHVRRLDRQPHGDGRRYEHSGHVI